MLLDIMYTLNPDFWKDSASAFASGELPYIVITPLYSGSIFLGAPIRGVYVRADIIIIATITPYILLDITYTNYLCPRAVFTALRGHAVFFLFLLERKRKEI